MHFIITIQNGWDEATCIRQLKVNDIDIHPLSDYSFDKVIGPPRFVLGFGGIPIDKIEAHTQQLIASFNAD